MAKNLVAFPGPTDANSAADSWDNNNANIQSLAVNRIGTGDPSAPGDGADWVDDDTTTQLLWRARINGANITLARWDKTLGLMLNQALAGNGQQLNSVLLEQIAPFTAAGNEARFGYDPAKKQFYYSDGTVIVYAPKLNADGTSFQRIGARKTLATLGTPGTPSTDTIAEGIELGPAASEQVGIIATEPVPLGWTAAHDVLLDVEVLLLAVETAGDVLDATLVWRSVANGTEVITKATSAASAVALDIASGNAIGTRHVLTFALTFNDATNPPTSGTILSAELTHQASASAGKVNGIIVTDASFRVPVFNLGA